MREPTGALPRNAWLIAPYAAWMALMSALPTTAGCYAMRGAATLALLVGGFACVADFRAQAFRQARQAKGWVLGAAAGLLVLAVWMAPAAFPGLFGHVAESASPYDPKTCGWALTLAKLAASAFVISVAEELFFRKWLVEFAGFGWMVALFAVNHWRWDLGLAGRLAFVAEGAFAGVVYGMLARKCGIFSSIVAHAVTNLSLGIVIIATGQWQFW